MILKVNDGAGTILVIKNDDDYCIQLCGSDGYTKKAKRKTDGSVAVLSTMLYGCDSPSTIDLFKGWSVVLLTDEGSLINEDTDKT